MPTWMEKPPVPDGGDENETMKTETEPKVKTVRIRLCEACLNGEGQECHTPGCALFLHNSPGHPIMPELYEELPTPTSER